MKKILAVLVLLSILALIVFLCIINATFFTLCMAVGAVVLIFGIAAAGWWAIEVLFLNQ